MSEIVLPRHGGPSALRPDLPIGARAVTPSDVAFFSEPVSLYVGGTGNVVVTPAGREADVTFTNFPGGSVLPCRVHAVKATGTTATNIIAVY